MNGGEFVKIKSLIVNGKDHIETVETEIGLFQIRPLTKGEKDQIAAIENRGMSTQATQQNTRNPDVGVVIDHEKLFNSQNEAFNLTLSCGLSVGNEKVTVEDIKNLDVKTEILEKVVKEIRKISGVSNMIDNFREYFERTGTFPVNSKRTQAANPNQ